MAAEPLEELTIDELARRTGMTVRNIRAHQSRGLLPPPAVRGRTGYYGPDHIARVELVKELQADGFNLELIRKLLEEAGGSVSEVLRFRNALRVPFRDEEPQLVELADLVGAWGTADPDLLARALGLGLVRALDDGRFELRSPRLLKAGQELGRLGVPLASALGVVERLREESDVIARMFAELFLEVVWQPFEEAGHPQAQWPDVNEALERLRPLASESLLAVFQMAMEDAVEEAFGREVQRLGS